MALKAQRLPTELIQDIIVSCCMHNTKELANLCLVCSTVCSWVRPLLYHTVRLSTQKQFDSFARSCAVAQGGEYTHGLVLDLMIFQLDKLVDLLGRLPNLGSLRIGATELLHVAPILRVPHLYLSGAIHAPLDAALLHTTHLFLEDPRCANAFLLCADEVGEVFPNLTHVALLTRPCRGSVLRAIARVWLGLSNVQRLTVCIVFDDATQRNRMIVPLWGELLALGDDRVFVHPMDAVVQKPKVFAALDRKAYYAQITGAALSSESVRGMQNVWKLGTRPWSYR
ncbi:hypothetical protein AURDEDRAFT_126440 [Auricularia subglabra TFB-10046 SS5]|nr:hypothetical protein AURDEDRAFT_126440 [Auricularia subglabra TFB-10046 SS5]